MDVDEITERIIGCAIEVHRHLGAGLLESVYEAALLAELDDNGLVAERQKPVPVTYKGRSIGDFRLDLLVEGCVVVELKSVERFEPLFDAQVLGYMRLGGYHTALLINFNTRLLKHGVKRFVI
ncbi:MAG TPA: GxxExxY protein [Gammaproteobacteria bacterium]|nr:GxxExxY protein [Gammaproteobacteria bacterium]